MKPITGLFLGAGASYEAGMPLVWELTDEIKSWLTPQKLRHFNTLWRLHGGGHADEVINDFVSVLKRPNLHYEAILGYLEAQFRRHNNALRQEYHGLYSWLVEMVYHILYCRQVNNERFLGRQLPRYDGIRALVDASQPLWVFSLNHDVMIETIAARLSIPLHTGFSETRIALPRRDSSGRKKGEQQAEVLRKQDLEHGAMHFPNPLQPGIYLMKIHGALDIFTFNEGQDLLKLLPEQPGGEGFIDVLRAANEDLFFPIAGAPRGRAKATNEIAYADDQGEMQFLRRSLLAGAFKFDARGHQVLPQSMLRHFRDNLNFVTNLICVGYGFADLHINAVLRDWLDFSAQRKLEIVNPAIADVPAFLMYLDPQVTLTKSDATDYLDKQAGIERSRREKLEKRLRAVFRKLGRERATQAFADLNRARTSRFLLTKLKELPSVDGLPDFSKLGDLNEVAKRWAAEAGLSDEATLEALLAHLNEAEPTQTPKH